MSRVQRPESSVQSLASRVQRPRSSVQSPVSGVQRPESGVQRIVSSIQSTASRVQRPTLVCRIQEFRYAVQNVPHTIKTEINSWRQLKVALSREKVLQIIIKIYVVELIFRKFLSFQHILLNNFRRMPLK